jgi:hypothetical protein
MSNKVSDNHLEKYHTLSEEYSFNECDGFSRILADEMLNDGYKPTIQKGRVRLHNQTFAPHFWVVVAGEIFDFRLRMWFGTNAPHGKITDLDIVYTHGSNIPLADEVTIFVLKIKPNPLFINHSK